MNAMFLSHYASHQIRQSSMKKTDHLKRFDYFDVIITGDDPRIPKGKDKPCSDIYHIGFKRT